MGYFPISPDTKGLALRKTEPEELLNHDLLLLGIHPTLRVLRGYSDQAFAGGQRRREIVEGAIGSYDRHLVPVHHDARVQFGLAGHLDDVAVLNQGINIEFDG